MSNIEKIRQEIERRKKVYLTKNGFPKGTFGAIKIETYEGLLAFIDSLPEESENHGCGVEFPHFGANYPDAKCIDGYLWDMDSYEDGIYTIGGDDPCPICNTEKWLKDVLDDEIFKTRDEALEYVKMLKSKYKHKDSLPEETCKDSLEVPETCKENADSFTEDLEEAAKKRKMGITPIGIIRMKVQELKWADVDKAGDLDIHPLKKDKYDYSIKQCDKIIAFIDNLPLTIAKESPVLNEAADDYQTTFNKTIGPFFHDDQKRAFIDGALWQARQLIKSTPNRKP